MSDKQYTSDTIVVYQDLQHVRAVPKAYIKSNDSDGILHTAWEYIANSIDEITMRPEGGTIYVALLRDLVGGRFQFIIKDNGRGIPYSKLAEVITKIGASGKISAATAYRASGGQLGMGAKAAAALSTHYRTMSFNYLEDRVGSVTLRDGELVDSSTCVMTITPGVTATFELDIPKFFSEGADFARVGYLDLTQLLAQLNIFNQQIDFKFYILDRLLPEEYWTAPIPDALGMVDNLLFSAPRQVIYDSATIVDKTAHLFTKWKVNSGLVFTDSFEKSAVNANDKLSFSIKLFFSKKSATGNPQYFVAVNNVNLVEKSNSDPIIAFTSLLRDHISRYQPTPEYRTFVQQNYNFPTLLLAVDIKYDGAKFSGVTKTNFKDADFVRQFMTEADTTIMQTRGEDFWQKLSVILADDIQLQYSRYFDVPLKKSEGRRVFMELKFPQNYHECKSSDNTKCELYIVEGTSAGNIAKTRDSNYQAIYETRGKPFNAATTLDSIGDNRKKLLKYDIYQDLVKILNISPSTTDMSTARFSKIIIATDADPDGSHITTIHVNDLYILNPRIITSGMLWVARPPLYSMEISKGNYLFLRDMKALADAQIKFFYQPSLELTAVTSQGETPLTDELFREAIYLVKEIGGKYNLVAKQLNIPVTVVERLVYGLPYIYPTIDYKMLLQAFRSTDDASNIRIQTDEIRQMLIISIGMRDYQISLHRIGEMLIQYVLPVVKKYRATEIYYKVKTKLPGSAFHDQPCLVSLGMLFEILTTIDSSLSSLRIHRYKGLGEMPTDSCYQTLMNPASRTITQITDVGDAEVCYGLLSKTDSSSRKKLMAGSIALSNTFMRQNGLFNV